MYFLDEIVAKLVVARNIFRNRGLEKHAQDLDTRVGTLIFEGADDVGPLLTSHAPTSDTGRTVTARMTSQERMKLRRIRKQRQNRKPARKKWLCCEKLEKRRTRKGQAWITTCHFRIMSGKNSGNFSASSMVLSYGATRPSKIMVGKEKKKMSICRQGQVEREKAKFRK